MAASLALSGAVNTASSEPASAQAGFAAASSESGLPGWVNPNLSCVDMARSRKDTIKDIREAKRDLKQDPYYYKALINSLRPLVVELESKLADKGCDLNGKPLLGQKPVNFSVRIADDVNVGRLATASLSALPDGATAKSFEWTTTGANPNSKPVGRLKRVSKTARVGQTVRSKGPKLAKGTKATFKVGIEQRVKKGKTKTTIPGNKVEAGKKLKANKVTCVKGTPLYNWIVGGKPQLETNRILTARQEHVGKKAVAEAKCLSNLKKAAAKGNKVIHKLRKADLNRQLWYVLTGTNRVVGRDKTYKLKQADVGSKLQVKVVAGGTGYKDTAKNSGKRRVGPTVIIPVETTARLPEPVLSPQPESTPTPESTPDPTESMSAASYTYGADQLPEEFFYDDAFKVDPNNPAALLVRRGRRT